jgi:DNA topoisomerase-1
MDIQKQKRLKKYIYDPIKEAAKQCHLLEFYQILPTLRKDIREHLDHFTYSQDHIIYLILAIIDLCHFRVGNTKYTKSTGVSTLKKEHIQSNTSCSSISFHGKRQVINQCDILNKRMNNILMKLAEYKDDDDFLFTYRDEYDNEHRITAEQVNGLLSRYGNITTKMFRTWKANYYFIKSIKVLDFPTTKTAIKKNISKAVENTAIKLHHTKAICRRSYIDSRIVKLYQTSPQEFLNAIQSVTNKNQYLLDDENDVIELLGSQC